MPRARRARKCCAGGEWGHRHARFTCRAGPRAGGARELAARDGRSWARSIGAVRGRAHGGGGGPRARQGRRGVDIQGFIATPCTRRAARPGSMPWGCGGRARSRGRDPRPAALSDRLFGGTERPHPGLREYSDGNFRPSAARHRRAQREGGPRRTVPQTSRCSDPASGRCITRSTREEALEMKSWTAGPRAAHRRPARVGAGADEMLPGFAGAVSMGATKEGTSTTRGDFIDLAEELCHMR